MMEAIIILGMIVIVQSACIAFLMGRVSGISKYYQDLYRDVQELRKEQV